MLQRSFLLSSDQTPFSQLSSALTMLQAHNSTTATFVSTKLDQLTDCQISGLIISDDQIGTPPPLYPLCPQISLSLTYSPAINNSIVPL
jgi:hypothetical protein